MYLFEEHFDFLEDLLIFTAGKNATENQTLLIAAEPTDLWFHVANVPSSHLIVKINDLKLTKIQKKKIITRAAILLKSISKQNNISKLEIIYTNVDNVMLTDIDGLVNIVKFKSIVI